MPSKHSIGFYSFLFIYILGIFSLGNWINRDQSSLLLLAYISAFLSYLFILQHQEHEKVLFVVGILVRLLLLLHLPVLSDDLYRFIWDGTLLKNGVNPYEALPSYHLDQSIPGISSGLFELLNSPNYYTVYPPLNQFIFWMSATIGDENWLLNANAIRLLLIGADISAYFLLKAILNHQGKPRTAALLYFLNPLVVIEFTGNLHFEGLVVAGVLLGIYGLQKKRYGLSATGIGLAIGTKLLPLIFLPFLFFSGLRNKTWWVPILAGCIALLTLIPMLTPAFINGMQESLSLYFQSFEFNASIYFLARAVGYWIYGYNAIGTIGPFLSLISLITILLLSIIAAKKKWKAGTVFLFILTTYLLFTTTVHPWYILPLVAYGIISSYKFPIVWSFFIFLTYLGYSKTGFELPYFIVVIEYGCVIFTFILEVIFRSNKKI